MFFRPSFCANCGEKIERTDWTILTSRRFCPVCEIEFKGHELLPRAIVAGGILVGLIGVGAYLKSGTTVATSRSETKPQSLVERPSNSALRPAGPMPRAEPTQSVAQNTAPQASLSPPIPVRPTVVTSEPQYYCGAETKKGTACMRRVKGNVRCYQHVGMPAIAGADRLTAKK